MSRAPTEEGADASEVAAPAAERDWTAELDAGGIAFSARCGDADHRFLSNLHECRVAVGPDEVYASVEHGFQCRKALLFGREDVAKAIRGAAKPGGAKQLGGKRGGRLRLSEAEAARWNAVSEAHMLELVRAKFAPGTELAGRLLATGDRALVEKVVPRGDKLWGVNARNVGRNRLGVLLMRVRAELAGRAVDC